MKKKRKKAGSDAYKRKSNVGGWILFFVVVGVLVWYVRMQPGGEAIEAQRDPKSALQQYARIAYKVSHGETGGEASIDKLLALCTEDDRIWFDKNYARIYQKNVTDRIGGSASPIEKRNYAIRDIIDKGLNRPEYKIVEERELNRTWKFTLEVPGPFDTTRTVRVEMVKEDGLWKMKGIGGGR